MASHLFIGLMSGTSLDGVDAVLADFSAMPGRLLASHRHAFPADLRAELLALQRPGANELHRAALAANDLARVYAAAVESLLAQSGLSPAEVRAAGVHGQTVRHRPESGYTLQLNAPALLAELCGIDVVHDFRGRDVAAGGQGAPLVPAFHAAVFGDSEARAVVNIGGIANVTLLPGARGGEVAGHDCGPGNVLLDLWTERHLGAPFDRDGAWAAQGRSIAALLEVFLSEPYFSTPPPKSTGRDLFHEGWLGERLRAWRGHEEPVSGTEARDVQATLAELTVETIARAIEGAHEGPGEIIVCGGGAFNTHLMALLARRCAPCTVLSSIERGIAPDHVEALAFAWLAREHVLGRPGNVPSVTGARGERVLGSRTPRS